MARIRELERVNANAFPLSLEECLEKYPIHGIIKRKIATMLTFHTVDKGFPLAVTVMFKDLMFIEF